jgi:catechol 2,3-dioxygenase-like lactoylglutathione lyase family enzyme
MIDHLTLTVRDLDRARSFFAEALAPLGHALQMEFEGLLGYGAPGKPALWLKAGPTGQAMHLAFIAPDRGAVDRFHAAAVAAGATDNGAPGLRPEYHAHYYGAFVIDPDGNNLEAVVHRAPGSAARKATIRAKARKLAARRPPPRTRSTQATRIRRA